jgi:hypothetical protein
MHFVYYNNVGGGTSTTTLCNSGCEPTRQTACGHAVPHRVSVESVTNGQNLFSSNPNNGGPTTKMVFLQRGVDPNSPKIPMRIDMSRMYGVDYDTMANIYGAYWLDENNFRFAIKQGNYRMNIPIQAGGDETGVAEQWTSINPNGLFLPRHNEITNNDSDFSSTWSNVHFRSYTYNYNANEWVGGWTSDSLKYYSALDNQTNSNSDWWADNSGYDFGYVTTGLRDSQIGNATLTVAAIQCQDTLGSALNKVNELTSDNYFTRSFVFSNSLNGGKLIRSTCNGGGGFNQECDYRDGPNCGEYAGCMFGCGIYHHMPAYNRDLGNVSGYFDREYVEGASAFLLTGAYSFGVNYGSNGVHVNPNGCTSNVGGQGDQPVGWTEIYSSSGSIDSCPDTFRYNWRIIPESAHYISPTYATMTTIVAGTYTQECLCTYSNRSNIVIRTDRLPSSDTPEVNGAGNGYLLNQNAGFSVYRFSGGCDVQFLGGGEIGLPQTNNEDINNDNLPTQFQTVANSLNSCESAVDLNSYLVDDEGVPYIGDEDPYSVVDANVGKDYVFFQRGVGCYNLISKPILSLIGINIQDDPYERRYSDIRIVVEWVQRLKLNFALCFNVFSHTFSNNWINGTLFAFPFKNTTYFDSNNDPYRIYCQRNIYFSNILNSYFYRSSPYDGDNDIFVGRPSSNSYENYSVDDPTHKRGNVKNLLYPTTIMDLGPKNQFIQ